MRIYISNHMWLWALMVEQEKNEASGCSKVGRLVGKFFTLNFDLRVYIHKTSLKTKWNHSSQSPKHTHMHTQIQKVCFDAQERHGGKYLSLCYYMNTLIRWDFPGQGPYSWYTYVPNKYTF